MKKVLLSLFALLFVVVLLTACSQTTTTTAKKTTKENTTAETQNTTKADDQTTKVEDKTSQSSVEVFEELKEAAKGAKCYLTTCGQADVMTVENIIGNVDPEEETVILYEEGDAAPTTGDVKIMKSSDLEASEVELATDGAKLPVVFLIVGTSSKGLGAAGTNVQKETERATAFSNLAKQGKIVLVLLHVGGEARRGEMSDPVITAAVPGASAVFVKTGGNKDGLFTTLCTANNITNFVELEKLSALQPYLASIFGMTE